MSGRGRGRGGYGGAGRGRGGQGVGQQSASFHPQGRGAGGRGNEQSYGYRAITPVVASSSTVPTMQSRELQNVSFGSAAEGSSRTFASGSVQPQPATQRPPVQVPAGSSVGRGQGRGGAQSSPVGGIVGGSTAVPSVASSSTDLTPSRELKNLSLGSAAPAAVGTTVASALVQPQQSMQQLTAQPDLSVSTQQSNVGSGSEAVPLVPSSSKLHKAPARPGYGTAGKKCVIKANHFCVEFGDKDPYQYDVTITPEVTSKTKCRDIMKCLIKDYRVSHMGNRPLAYDGKKSAFVAGPLPFESKEFVIVVPEKDGRQREFKVAIKFAAKKDLHHLREFLSGRQLDNPQETIQALDVVLREAASKGREIVGRSIFSTAFGKGSLGNGIEYWRGFYQSLRPTQMGLSLNVDMSARAFYDSILVSDFVMAYLAKDVTRPLSDQERIRVKKALRGVRVRVTHGGFNRSYKVHSITTQTTSQLTFPIDESGTVISVIQYFRDKYNFTLQFPFLPAIQAGTDAKPTYLPMEICSLVDGQRYSKKLNERQVTQMLRATCKRPNERENEIKTVIRGNNYANDELVKDFGLQVREQLTSIEARVLPPPPLKYHESGRKSEVYPSVGQWNMMDLKMINGGTVNFWAVVNFSRHRQNAVDNFRDGLISMCIEKGMVFDRQPLIPTFNASPQSIEKALVDVHNQCCAQLARTSRGHFQLLFVILPEISGSYGKLLITQSLNLEKIRREGKIKRICETELGIVSQCCQPKHVMKPNRQYFENVALKINVKVGGRNTILSATLNKMLPMVTDRPTIIFGADVTHPQPGEDSGPSIAAVVASMDWPYVTKYRALMSAQPHRQEIIEDLYTTYTDAQRGLVHAGLIRDHLIAFKNATGHKPHRIIFYRDGVSEGQFSHVLLHEMDKIRKACVSLEENYLPRVTFIVVQKRHHTRLFPANHGDRQTTDRSGNILPGTVVDTNICHPTEFDFYLCSHAGIQGTSRPTHYHVLYDENKFTADGLQTLTNSLCYTYARCTRSVSIVPPAYYAHLTAFRARYYTEGMASESESAVGGRATRERTAEVRQLPMIRDNVKAVMFYC